MEAAFMCLDLDSAVEVGALILDVKATREEVLELYKRDFYEFPTPT